MPIRPLSLRRFAASGRGGSNELHTSAYLQHGDNLAGFSSGVDLVDQWLARRASGARAAGTAVVYVTFCGDALAGFYTLSAQSITRSETSGWIARNAPQQIPVILLGMLGVDQRFQGQGLGRDLLLDAVHRAESVAEQIGARALVVDPIDNVTRSFYEKYGFRPIPGSSRLFAKL